MIRWMLGQDHPEVVAVERLTMGRRAFDAEAMKVIAVQDANVLYVVESADGRVVGHVIAGLYRHRVVVHRLCVHPDYQRFGYGSVLIRKLKEKCETVWSDRRGMLVMVDETNLAAQLFLSRHGFVGELVEHCCDVPMVEFTWDAESGVTV